jgi:hypothetical protein
MMIRSPFGKVTTTQRQDVLPGSTKDDDKNGGAVSLDPEDDEIVSLEFDALTSCSGSHQALSEEEGEEDNDDDDDGGDSGDSIDPEQIIGSGSLHSSVTSFSSSVTGSLHSSSSRFMDSVRNIHFLPRRRMMKPTLEKYNELPDESGGNSSIELALELDKIGMDHNSTDDDAMHVEEAEPSDPHLIANLEDVMALEGNNEYSIVLDQRDAISHELNLSPLSLGRPVVDLSPLSPVRRASRKKTGTAKKKRAAKEEEEENKTRTPRKSPQRGVRRGQPLSASSHRNKLDSNIALVSLHKSSPAEEAEEDKTRTPRKTPQRSVRRGQPLSASSHRNKLNSNTALASLHKSSPADLDHSPAVAVKETVHDDVVRHHGSTTTITSSSRRRDPPSSSYRNNSSSISPRRRFRHTQPNHHNNVAQQSSPNLAPTTPILISRHSRRRMSVIQSPDLSNGGNVATPGGGPSQEHLQRSKLFINRHEGSLMQRSISTDSTDLGRIARRSSTSFNDSANTSLNNASLGTLKTDFLGKPKPKRERTKFDFDPKSLKEVLLAATEDKATAAASSSTTTNNNKRKVTIHPVITLHSQSLIGV